MTKNQNDRGADNSPKGQEQKGDDLKKENNPTHKPEVGKEEKQREKVNENGSRKPETETPVAEKESETGAGGDW